MLIKRFWLVTFLLVVLFSTLLLIRTKNFTIRDSSDIRSETALTKKSAVTCQMTRMEFFERIQCVEVGMSKNDVIERIGRPDDVVINKEYQAVYAPGVSEVWRYGNSPKLQFPTFGRIEFNYSGSVDEIVGVFGSPFVSDELNEQKLRYLLEQLDRMQGLSGARFDPSKLVKLVNEFQPLEQELSFKVFREYVRISGYTGKGTDEFLLLLSCLYELPKDGFFPWFSIGCPGPKPPTEPRYCPQFPIKIIDDLPLLVIHGSSASSSFNFGV